MATTRAIVKGFYEEKTGSIQYVVACPVTRSCAIIDPVLDYDSLASVTSTRSADELLAYVCAEGLQLEWILDTHPHADHLSAAAYLKDMTGVRTAIGQKVCDVQRIWQKIYNLPDSGVAPAECWDVLFADGDVFRIGDLPVRVIHSPGHTLASITYLVGDAAFIHDTLLMPDSGSARADFPGGDARALWRSIDAILSLPKETRLFVGHDYRAGGREARWETSVAEQQSGNVHLVQARTEEEFVKIREKRDATLPLPKLIFQALQVNVRGGRLPDREDNGQRYLKLPIFDQGQDPATYLASLV